MYNSEYEHLDNRKVWDSLQENCPNSLIIYIMTPLLLSLITKKRWKIINLRINTSKVKIYGILYLYSCAFPCLSVLWLYDHLASKCLIYSNVLQLLPLIQMLWYTTASRLQGRASAFASGSMLTFSPLRCIGSIFYIVLWSTLVMFFNN